MKPNQEEEKTLFTPDTGLPLLLPESSIMPVKSDSLEPMN
jgi:hypothetical protein